MTTHAALVELVGVGLVWMAVHCAGMCGPLLTGLHVGGPAKMLQYQAGKAVTYASLGALAGAFGGGLAHISSSLGALLAVTLGLIAIIRALRRGTPSSAGLVQIGRVQRRLRPVLFSTSPWRPALLGVALGFLPCMIALWALGLAALTGSVFGGALVMLVLAAMTTPVVLLIGTGAKVLRVKSARVSQVLLAISGAWLILVGLAGAKLIEHVHVAIADGYSLMLW